MSPEVKKDWLQNLLASSPGDEAWTAGLTELGRRFGKLDSEAQTAAAEFLSKHAAEAKETIDKLIASSGVKLPALLALLNAKKAAGGEVPFDMIAVLTKWTALCEDDQGECEPIEFFNLEVKYQEAIVEHLVDWLRADLLANLAEAADDKERQKALKKAVHRARSAGAAVDESVGMAQTAAFKAPERDAYVDEAYVSPPDYNGVYFVYFYKTVYGKNQLYVILVGDYLGVIRYESHEVPEPKFRRILESTRKNPHAVLIKTDSNWARLLVRRAEEAGQKRGTAIDRDYLTSRRAIGIAEQPDFPHPVWKALDEKEIKDAHGLVTMSKDLADHRLFEDWRLANLEEGRIVGELEAMRQSPIQIPEHEKSAREEALFQREAAVAIESLGREAWKERMLNCAYLLEKMGDREAARSAAAVGLALVRAKDPVPAFFIEIMKRTVMRDMAPEGEGPSGPDMGRGGIVAG